MKTITVKTSELTGPALDWAVAEAEGLKPSKNWTGMYYRPSTDWSVTGDLIDRHNIWFSSDGDNHIASLPPHLMSGVYPDDIDADFPSGPTKLTAACRAIVASKLGDTVEVPEQLVEVNHGN